MIGREITDVPIVTVGSTVAAGRHWKDTTTHRTIFMSIGVSTEPLRIGSRYVPYGFARSPVK